LHAIESTQAVLCLSLRYLALFSLISDGCQQILFTYRGHASDVHLILPFAHHLISVDVTSTVKIWVIKEQGL